MTKSINISLLVTLAPLAFSIGGHGVNVCLALHLRTAPCLEKVEEVQRNSLLPAFHSLMLASCSLAFSIPANFLPWPQETVFVLPAWTAWSSQITDWLLRNKANRRASRVSGTTEREHTACRANLAQRKVSGSTQEVFCLFFLTNLSLVATLKV